MASTDMVEDDKSRTKPDLLSLCRAEQARALGFDQDAELRDDRERALNYYKGDVSKDIPSIPNRSKAVSTDISDAVETILPDLLEIFTGGDDVVSFKPQNQDDVEPSKQETEYLNHVVFHENPGFLNFHTAIKDALLVKIGVFTWEWVEEIDEQDEHFTGKNAVELMAAHESGEVTDVHAENEGADLRTGQQTYSFTVTKRNDRSKAVYYPVPPEDFAVAPDTVNIQDATYCVMRSRPRVQDLIAEGYDAAKVRELPTYIEGDEGIEQARDTAGESDNEGSTGDDSSDDLRQVEVRKHYIRCLNGNGKLDIWCVVTDAQAGIELDSYEVDHIPFAVGSPYLVAHRLIGRSLADVLIEVMKIKTALTRGVLDSIYFGLNQRVEVNMDRANDWTISDLLKNEPGMPVRSKGEAIHPIQAGGLNFDPYAALEYFSTVGEMQSGIVRNAQGLNPDTLHDTAKGALTLMSAAQKRTRFIARVLAETLIKPFYLGLHRCIRENAKATTVANLTGQWVPVNPTKWALRDAMTVEVGLGASGKEMEIASMTQIMNLQKLGVEFQGGADGPIITQQNLYKAATDFCKKLGVKAPEEYFSDPAKAPPQQPKPDPDMAKVQMDGQLKQAQMQQDGQIKSAQLQQEGQIKQAQTQSDAELQAQRLQAEIELKRYQTDQELLLKREQLAAELQLKREEMGAQLALQRELGHAKVQAQSANVSSDVHVGGDPG